jgi:hypothetical protein
MSNDLAVAMTFNDMSRLAEAIAKSGLFGMKTPEEALALMAIAQAEGQHPALAARDYHIVQKKPVLKASAMLARFQAAGGKMRYIERTDARVEAEFSHPQGGSTNIDWDMERAKRAGLAGRDNWKNYPRQMLTARVISEGINAIFPGATGGLMTPEEAADLPPEAPERDVTPKPLTGVAAIAAKVAERAPASESPPPVVDAATGEMFGASDGEPLAFADVAEEMRAAIEAKDTDALIAAVALLPRVANEQHRAELDVLARAGWKAIKAKAA